jgi:D-amino-acid oxidase
MVRESDRRVIVVGAGISGLTTAVCLAEAGFSVRVVAAAPPLETTSAAATGLVGLANGEPSDKIPGWVRCTVEELSRLLNAPEAGVRVERGLLASREPGEPPPMIQRMPGYARASGDELPQGFVDGFWLDMFLLDMARYLPYLTQRLESAGTAIEIRRIERLESLAAEAPVIVNCSGVEARSLASDDSVRPAWGMHVIVKNPGLHTHFMEGPPGLRAWTSWTPHGERVLIGGISVLDRWDRAADPEIAEALLARARAANPALADAPVLGTNVGLRPERPAVRLEREQLGEALCMHNYGHGGVGVTLSWGCAREVLSILNES